MEILYTILYAIFIGFYNVFKKQSTKKSNEIVVLVMFTSIAFFCSLLWIPFGIVIPLNFVFIFALKGCLLALSWLIILNILKQVDISLVSIFNAISSVLTFVLGIVIFNETTNALQIIGSIFIIISVACINIINKHETKKITLLHIGLLTLTACISTTSSMIDKYTTMYLTGFQVQFWFLLFVCVFSWLFFGILKIKNKNLKIDKTSLKNVWIYLIGILLFVGDFWLFQAYKVPNSQMITISILSKLQIVVTVISGIIIFKEKNIFKKLLLMALVLIGAILISI